MNPPPLVSGANGRASLLWALVAVLVRLPRVGTAAGVAAAGALCCPLAVLVAAPLAGPSAAAWTGALLALSPIHVIASRSATPDVLLVVTLLVALGLWAAVDRHGRKALALTLGLPVGGLVAGGSAGFAAVAVLLPAALAASRHRRGEAAVAALAALAVATAAALLGVARSPFHYGPDAAVTPAATAADLVRCAGASLTRVMGIEYQLVLPQARHALPLSGLFLALMTLGARGLPRRVGALLVAGALVPFAVGAAMALVTGHVAPLQAHRQLAALPFVMLLLAAGLASLRGTRAWAAGVLVLGSTTTFLALALLRYG